MALRKAGLISDIDLMFVRGRSAAGRASRVARVSAILIKRAPLWVTLHVSEKDY